MEEWQVIAVDMKSVMRFKNEGKEIPGVRWLLKGAEKADTPDARFLGFNWHDQFISSERLVKLNVAPRPGDVIRIHFNRYGDIVNVEVV